MKQKKQKLEEREGKENIKRLNVIIRLLIELNKNLEEKKFTMKSAARILHSARLTPIEIAHILGYKSGIAVAPYLYPKRKCGEKKK